MNELKPAYLLDLVSLAAVADPPALRAVVVRCADLFGFDADDLSRDDAPARRPMNLRLWDQGGDVPAALRLRRLLSRLRREHALRCPCVHDSHMMSPALTRGSA